MLRKEHFIDIYIIGNTNLMEDDMSIDNENTNIVPFPSHRIVNDTNLNIEKIEKVKLKSLENFCEGIFLSTATNIYETLEIAGLDISEEKLNRDLILIINLLKASLLRYFEIPHPLQEFIDKNMEIIDSEELESINSENNDNDDDPIDVA